MDDKSEEFDKIFSEMIDSEELKEIKESFGNNRVMTIKELLLVQQTLIEVANNVSDMIYGNLVDEDQLVFVSDNIIHSLLSSIYKSCIDFNDVISEYYGDEDDEYDIIFELDDDDDDDDEEEDIEEDE